MATGSPATAEYQGKRAVIIASGRVQGVGYRHNVEETAYKNNLAGFVENLRDGSVRIICEGPAEGIKKFYSQINLRKKWPIDVRELSALNLEPATGGFSAFKIKRGPFAAITELPRRADLAAVYMQALHTEVHQLREESGKNFNSLNGEMRQFREDTCRNFGSLDKKYGSISKNIGALSGTARQLSRDASVIADRFAKPAEGKR